MERICTLTRTGVSTQNGQTGSPTYYGATKGARGKLKKSPHMYLQSSRSTPDLFLQKRRTLSWVWMQRQKKPYKPKRQRKSVLLFCRCWKHQKYNVLVLRWQSLTMWCGTRTAQDPSRSQRIPMITHWILMLTTLALNPDFSRTTFGSASQLKPAHDFSRHFLC